MPFFLVGRYSPIRRRAPNRFAESAIRFSVVGSTWRPKTRQPIHPSVVRHFGLRFVGDDRRWQFMHEGGFTTREFYLRYMDCAWNEPLAEGLGLVHGGEFDAALTSLETGLALSPGSAAGHGALRHVLTRLCRSGEER